MKYVFLVLSVLLVGCATTVAKFEESVHVGDSEQHVRETLGRPLSRTVREDGRQLLEYSVAPEPMGTPEAYLVVFENGKTVAFGPASQLRSAEITLRQK